MPLHYRSDALHRCLHDLHRQAPGLRGSAIITHDGLVIAAYPPGWDSNIHDPTGGENVAAMAAVVVSTANRAMERLAQGELERVLMEGARGTMGVWPTTPDAALAILIEKEAKLGLTLLAARQTAQEIRTVLSEAD